MTDRPAEGVLRLRLNRPDRLNAINAPLVGALISALDNVEARSVVLDSSSSQAFCSGVDLDIEDVERAKVSDLLYELYEKIVKLPVPVVAAINGHVVGAGVQLVVAADLRVAGPETKMRVAGPGHGLAVAGWGLPSLIGRGRALDLCLTMRAVGAEEALGIGLVDRIEREPSSAALDLALAFAQLDQEAVSRVKSLVTGSSGLLRALREERDGNRRAWSGSVAQLISRRGEETR
ncbi:Enoyl-CoA hydratase/isomerase [Rubrobacter xylanophilus DSM 9941]|uniref:Enoyl-CoA hydratase/isomerase n=1 Tax=Rubrobacter xylanophilus (strain DSM 9941 / JCM 11954 / NBRC 16129 / PRD-1) TaxID=266117 RepID=Q1AUW0_RUBXD|nr:Enoyl-CoA hydratase/isomerase [Rubrobacter xylanophilus DSM 9941]